MAVVEINDPERRLISSKCTMKKRPLLMGQIQRGETVWEIADSLTLVQDLQLHEDGQEVRVYGIINKEHLCYDHVYKRYNFTMKNQDRN